MRYNENEYCIEATAEELCTLAAHTSDLGEHPFPHTSIHARGFDAFLSQLPDYDRALEPLRADVELLNTVSLGGNYYTLTSVADRAYSSGDVGFVDRFVDLRGAGAPIPDRFDVALLKTNAYFYACKHSLPRVNVRLVFCLRATGKITVIEDSFLTSDLRRAYLDLLGEAEVFTHLTLERKSVELPRSSRVPFPYTEMRAGQEQMMRTVYRGIVKGKKVFVQAPTGIGKTVSALYPAARALSEGKIDKIFYLTAKASTRREAWSAMRRLHSAGSRLRAVAVSARDSVCLCTRRDGTGLSAGNFCNALDCELARGYYERRNAALADLTGGYYGYTQGLIMQVAKKHNVCPYELSLDLSELCDVVICDYNYIFDPIIYFQRYFGDEAEDGRYVFIVDEAHNLPDRAISMYSAELSRNAIESVASTLLPSDRELCGALDGFLRILNASRKLCRDNMTRNEQGDEQGYYISKNAYFEIEKQVDTLCNTMNSWLRVSRLSPAFYAVKGLYSELSRYKRISELYDEHYVFFIEVAGGDIKVRLSCLDPSHALSLCHSRAVSSIMLSATLEPMDYFSDILGGDRSSIRLELPSPFERDNLGIFCVDHINTRFEDRATSHRAIASCIAATVSGRAGNYIVFFPSYSYLNGVREEFERKYPKVKLLVQRQDMTHAEREALLSELKNDTGVLRIGFCVLGGSFSEGIDLPGSRLIGTVIVGVGLPGISNERNVMKEYFDNTRENGYDYAYTYPGMNRVLQAAGRVIRTESDRGVVVLIDDRYATEQYRAMFPTHWSHAKFLHSTGELAKNVRNFWQEQ